MTENNNKIAQELWELRVELKFMSKTLDKMEKVFEWVSALMSKQEIFSKRIMALEDKWDEIDDKIRILEDWKMKSIFLASIIATVIWFLVNKFI